MGFHSRLYPGVSQVTNECIQFNNSKKILNTACALFDADENVQFVPTMLAFNYITPKECKYETDDKTPLDLAKKFYEFYNSKKDELSKLLELPEMPKFIQETHDIGLEEDIHFEINEDQLPKEEIIDEDLPDEIKITSSQEELKKAQKILASYGITDITQVISFGGGSKKKKRLKKSKRGKKIKQDNYSRFIKKGKMKNKKKSKK